VGNWVNWLLVIAGVSPLCVAAEAGAWPQLTGLDLALVGGFGSAAGGISVFWRNHGRPD